MRRRELLVWLGALSIEFSSSIRAQTSKKHLIGVLEAASPESATPQAQAFLAGLRDIGYVAGRDYEIVVKSAYGRDEILPELAEILVRLNPDVLVAVPMPAVLALKAVTNTIPVTSFMLADEIRLGLAASDARPGGNVTGLAMRVDGLVGKQIELAKRVLPSATALGILINPDSEDSQGQRQEARLAATAQSLTELFVEIRSPDEVAAGLDRLRRENVQVVVCLYDALFFQERKTIAQLATDQRLPTVYAARDHAAAGGLISYGVSLQDNARRLSAYIDKIFRGANPADLPIEFPAKLELVINLRTARALGLAVPSELLATADEVIE
jgi:putative tryptophan/tyrosine transport system substrate-binding protein